MSATVSSPTPALCLMKLLMFLLATILGTVGWYAGEDLGGTGAALLFSALGSILGVYLVWRLEHHLD